jgi:hypothetical protein
VTQFLSMFNGVAEQQVLQKSDSELRLHLKEAASSSEECDVAYLSVLNRLPTDEEREAIRNSLQVDDKKRDLDIAWALLNSAEFLFY